MSPLVVSTSSAGREHVATVSEFLTGLFLRTFQIIEVADPGHGLAYMQRRTRGQESADRGDRLSPEKGHHSAGMTPMPKDKFYCYGLIGRAKVDIKRGSSHDVRCDICAGRQLVLQVVITFEIKWIRP